MRTCTLRSVALPLHMLARSFRRFLVLSFASLFLPLSAQIGTVSPNSDPKDAVGWFKRARDQMSLRAYDATPFHMRVAFKALPGLELTDGKKPQVISGDGVYEETWIAPHHWRREVTLGDYHAVEVESQAGRKMQFSTDYEPSRVLMLLDALFYPIRREHISPDVERGFEYRDWTIEHKAAGSIPYVLIRADFKHLPIDVNVNNMPQTAYAFLPGGMLVESIGHGMTIRWQDDATFAGHTVPRRLTVQSGDRMLLTADIAVQAAGQVDPAIFEMSGGTADPGMTLRPLNRFEVKPPGTDERCSAVPVDQSAPLLPLVTREIIDRHGATQEVELIDARNMEVKENSRAVADLLDCRRKIRVRPATIDKSPAELAMAVVPTYRFNHK